MDLPGFVTRKLKNFSVSVFLASVVLTALPFPNNEQGQTHSAHAHGADAHRQATWFGDRGEDAASVQLLFEVKEPFLKALLCSLHNCTRLGWVGWRQDADEAGHLVDLRQGFGVSVVVTEHCVRQADQTFILGRRAAQRQWHRAQLILPEFC